MSRMGTGAGLLWIAILVLAGCSGGNGLTADIQSHLAARGIEISPTRLHAPVSSRGGYVVAPYDSQMAYRIVSAFNLETIQPDDPRWRLATECSDGVPPPTKLWGASGRPPQFKLKGGGQFEFFFVLAAADGSMYLLAEYAYG